MEGDGGDTFIVGTAPEMQKCADAARSLFHVVRKKWESTGMSGKALYEFAVEEANPWATN